jgi:predicted DNA-binding protein
MKEQLHIRLSKEEMDKLRAYAESTQRTQTDIIREFLRSLPDA